MTLDLGDGEHRRSEVSPVGPDGFGSIASRPRAGAGTNRGRRAVRWSTASFPVRISRRSPFVADEEMSAAPPTMSIKPTTTDRGPRRWLAQIKAVVLLGGAVRQKQADERDRAPRSWTCRSKNGRSMLWHWQEEGAGTFAGGSAIASLPVRGDGGPRRRRKPVAPAEGGAGCSVSVRARNPVAVPWHGRAAAGTCRPSTPDDDVLAGRQRGAGRWSARYRTWVVSMGGRRRGREPDLRMRTGNA